MQFQEVLVVSIHIHKYNITDTIWYIYMGSSHLGDSIYQINVQLDPAK